MSKLPIAAFHPSGSINNTLYEAHIRNLSLNRIQDSIKQNLTTPTIILTDNNNIPSPVTLCVDGVLLWLLLAWITAGTAAIITLIVRTCRNKYNTFFNDSVKIVHENLISRWKQFDEEEFDWSGLDAIRSRSTKSQHTRSTSCSSPPSFRQKPTLKSSTRPPTTPSPPRLGHHRISTRLTSSFSCQNKW